jgi:UDP-glucuronate 4-epimerase
MNILVTGSAGFVGHHLSERLLAAGHTVTGVDCFVPYYSLQLKEDRHARLRRHPGFTEQRTDLADRAAVEALIAETAPEVVVHLAAQPGVRYALENPGSYIQSNVVGSFNLLETLRHQPARHLLMASTSSAYGANTDLPFREGDKADTPLTVYSATKRAMEHLAHAYAHLWSQPITAFRFFTVYGPWGRPDMAPLKFTKAAFEGTPIEVYNHGDMLRDFTYVGDLVEAIERLIPAVPVVGASVGPMDTLSPVAPYRLVNIGQGNPINLMEFIAAVERHSGRPLIRQFTDMQLGDVQRTWADTSLLQALTGFSPRVEVDEGVAALVAWYREYYGVS